MKKKKLLARVTALTLAAILMVPSSIGTTVLASPDNTEASAEAPGPDEASDKAEGTVQESESSDKSADGGQTAESQEKNLIQSNPVNSPDNLMRKSQMPRIQKNLLRQNHIKCPLRIRKMD